jgi:hypothetical protein
MCIVAVLVSSANPNRAPLFHSRRVDRWDSSGERARWWLRPFLGKGARDGELFAGLLGEEEGTPAAKWMRFPHPERDIGELQQASIIRRARMVRP